MTVLDCECIANLWDIKTRKKILVLEGHEDSITSVAFSSDGKTILTGSSDTTARLWDAKTGEVLKIFKEHTDKVNLVMFGPDGKTILIISSQSQTAHL